MLATSTYQKNKVYKVTLLILLLLISFIAIILRGNALIRKNVYGDEMLTVINVKEPFFSCLKKYPVSFFSYLLIRLSFNLLGENVITLRLFSFLLGIIAVLLIWKIGRKWFSNSVGLIAAFLLAISPIHIEYSADGRYYSIMTSFSLLSIYLFFRSINEKKKLLWALWIITNLLNGFNHPFAWLFLGAQLVFLFFYKILQFLSFSSLHHFLKVILFILIASVVILSGYTFGEKVAELFWNRIAAEKHTEEEFKEEIIVNLQFLKHTFRAYGPIRDYKSFFELYVFFLFFILGLISPFLLKLKENSINYIQVQFTILSVLIITIPFVFLSFVPTGGHFWEPKYTIFILPIYLLWIAQGVEFIGNLIKSVANKIFSTQTSIYLKGASVVLIVIFLICISLPALNQQWYSKGRHDFKSLTAFLESVLTDKDIIIPQHGWTKEAIEINLKNKTFSKNIVGFPLESFSKTFPELLSKYREIWLVMYYDPLTPFNALAYPRGELIQNKFLPYLKDQDNVDYLNHHFYNFRHFPPVISLFRLKRQNISKVIPQYSVGLNQTTIEAEHFYDLSPDISREEAEQNLFVKLATSKSYIQQKLLFESAGDYAMLLRYRSADTTDINVTEKVLTIELDNKPLFTISTSRFLQHALAEWAEETVSFSVSSGEHKLTIRNKSQFPVEIDWVKISMNEEYWQKQIPNKLYINFDNKLLFLGYKLDTEETYSRGSIKLTCYWKKIASFQQDYRVIYHYTYKNQFGIEIWDAGELYPIPYKLKDWRVGGCITQSTVIRVPKEATTGLYKLYVSVFDGKNLMPIANKVAGREGNRVSLAYIFIKSREMANEKKRKKIAEEFITIGLERFKENKYRDALAYLSWANKIYSGIVNSSTKSILEQAYLRTQSQMNCVLKELPDGFLRVDTNIADQLVLLGFQLNKSYVLPGDELKLTTYWQSLDKITSSSEVYLHLENFGKKEDRILGFSWLLTQGMYPLERWGPEEIVKDEFFFTIPREATPGVYHLYLGLLGGNRIKLADVFVEGENMASELYLAGLKAEKQFDYQSALKYLSESLKKNRENTLAKVAYERVKKKLEAHSTYILDSLPSQVKKMEIQFADLIKFLGYKLEQENVTAGSDLHITYFWQPLKKFEKEYKSFTHIELISNRTSFRLPTYYPVHYKLYPTTNWPVGKIIKEECFYSIPTNAPSGFYSIRVGMWDEKENLPIVNFIEKIDNRAHLADILVIGKEFAVQRNIIAEEMIKLGMEAEQKSDYPLAVDYYQKALKADPSLNEVQEILKRATNKLRWYQNPVIKELPPDMVEVNAQLADQIILLGYKINKTKFKIGDEVEISYYWKPIKPFTKDYFTFSHYDFEGNPSVKRISPAHLVANKFYPMRRWKENEIICDIVFFKIPSDAPAGKYSMLVGVWDGKENLKVSNEVVNWSGLPMVGYIEIEK